jgi:hypothetical protein
MTVPFPKRTLRLLRRDLSLARAAAPQQARVEAGAAAGPGPFWAPAHREQRFRLLPTDTIGPAPLYRCCQIVQVKLMP